MVSPGLDLELSFSQALQGFGFSPEVARLLWLPLPMLLVPVPWACFSPWPMA